MLNTAQTTFLDEDTTHATRAWDRAPKPLRSFRIPRYSVALVREDAATYVAATKAIREAKHAAELLRPIFATTDREMIVCITLDTKFYPIGINIVSTGTLDQSLVHPRETLKLAILQNAAAIILAHNHPSGDPAPSRNDQVITDRMVKAGELLGIRVLDHVILGDGTLDIFSFADAGRLHSGS